eukprot:15466796-Alexandrium_andersonii.AAC.1
MAVSSRERVHFAGGSPVPQAATVKYLGVNIEAPGSSTEEVSNRLAAASSAYAMLRPYGGLQRPPCPQNYNLPGLCLLQATLLYRGPFTDPRPGGRNGAQTHIL